MMNEFTERYKRGKRAMEKHIALILFEVERGDGLSFSVQYASNKWEGWLILDRVMDAPVYQAELTWDRSDQASPEVFILLWPKVKHQRCLQWRGMWIAC